MKSPPVIHDLDPRTQEPRVPKRVSTRGRLGTMGPEATRAADPQAECNVAHPPINPQDIQTLMSQTGQYLMDIGHIMRRAPEIPMNDIEHDAIIQAVNVVTEHLQTAREQLVAMNVVLAMNLEESKDTEHNLRSPEVPEVPKDTIGGVKGGSERGSVPSSKYDLLGAAMVNEAPKPAVTAGSEGEENGP